MKEVLNCNHVLPEILPVRSQMTSNYYLHVTCDYQIKIAKKTRCGYDFAQYCISRRNKVSFCVVFAISAVRFLDYFFFNLV
jgi:hypothetical protein